MPRLSGFKTRRQPGLPAKDANGTLSIMSLAGTYQKVDQRRAIEIRKMPV